MKYKYVERLIKYVEICPGPGPTHVPAGFQARSRRVQRHWYKPSMGRHRTSSQVSASHQSLQWAQLEPGVAAARTSLRRQHASATGGRDPGRCLRPIYFKMIDPTEFFARRQPRDQAAGGEATSSTSLKRVLTSESASSMTQHAGPPRPLSRRTAPGPAGPAASCGGRP